MSNRALQADLVARFGIAPDQADRMIAEAEAKASVKQAVALASRGGAVAKKDDLDYNENPAAWRHELHRRLAAIEVMQEGVGCLQELQKHIKAIIEAEEQLIQKKQAKVRDKQADWWDLRDSGWAMGGRERFATYVGDIFRNLDEGQLGGRVMDRMGFKRGMALPEIPEPVMAPVPQDAVQLEAALVRGAGIGRVPPDVMRSLSDPKLKKLWDTASESLQTWMESGKRDNKAHRTLLRASEKLAKKAGVKHSDTMSALQNVAVDRAKQQKAPEEKKELDPQQYHEEHGRCPSGYQWDGKKCVETAAALVKANVPHADFHAAVKKGVASGTGGRLDATVHKLVKKPWRSSMIYEVWVNLSEKSRGQRFGGQVALYPTFKFYLSDNQTVLGLDLRVVMVSGGFHPVDKVLGTWTEKDLAGVTRRIAGIVSQHGFDVSYVD